MKKLVKKILVRFKILTCVEPFYDFLISSLPKEKKRQKKLINFYSQFIKKGDLCFDIGAHRGKLTDIFLKLGARVIAVEPQENCYKYLEKKFNRNQNFTLIKKGLSNKEESLVLSICQNADDISTFSEKWKTGRFSDYKWNKKETINCITLDSLIKKYGKPVFCKIDVEGYEYKALKGLSRPISYLSFEFTKEFLKDAKICINHLFSLGYKQFNCCFGRSTDFIFEDWVESKVILKKLDLIEDNLLWGDVYAKY